MWNTYTCKYTGQKIIRDSSDSNPRFHIDARQKRRLESEESRIRQKSANIL